jgi:hypothetical protein
MSRSEKQLWMERIARALAELKKAPAHAHPGGVGGDARDTPVQPSQGK